MKHDTPWRLSGFLRPFHPPARVVGVNTAGERRVWASQSEAATAIGVTQSAVCQALRRGRPVRGWTLTPVPRQQETP